MQAVLVIPEMRVVAVAVAEVALVIGNAMLLAMLGQLVRAAPEEVVVLALMVAVADIWLLETQDLRGP
jgi:hypothetical protein